MPLDRLLLCPLALFAAPAWAHETHEPHGAHLAHHAPAPDATHALTVEAQKILETYTVAAPPEAPRLLFDFDDPARREFDFLPQSMRRGEQGLSLADMAPAQKRSTHALLRALLSQEGYLRVQAIRSLEDVLRAAGGDPDMRDPEKYSLRLYGRPGFDAPWGLRFEGHHVALSATVVDGQFRGTPLFLGASPDEVPGGAFAGLRSLQPHQDLARELLLSLSADQRSQVVQEAYTPEHRIQVGPLGPVGPAAGLPAARMSPAQRELLLRLVAGYASNLREDFAADELARVRAAGVEELHFLWRGETAPGRPCSYRVQGPTLVLDYDLIGSGDERPADHVHTLWRDPERDYGADLLAAHYAAEHEQDR